jgi:hypothetical protein
MKDKIITHDFVLHDSVDARRAGDSAVLAGFHFSSLPELIP